MDEQIRARLAAFAVVLIFVGHASPALAQVSLLGLTEQPEPFVREAFASPYGRALLAEFGKALRAAADPACLRSKNLLPEQLADRGGALLVEWGGRALEKTLTYIDPKVYATKFTASAGRNASADLARLREHRDVKPYIAIERPLRLAKIADFVLEQFDRYAVLNRIKIASVSPVSTGNDELLRASPEEATEAALETLSKTNKSAQLRQFLALSEKSAAAMAAAIKTEQVLLVSPKTYFGGVEADLAELCIDSRR